MTSFEVVKKFIVLLFTKKNRFVDLLQFRFFWVQFYFSAANEIFQFFSIINYLVQLFNHKLPGPITDEDLKTINSL